MLLTEANYEDFFRLSKNIKEDLNNAGLVTDEQTTVASGNRAKI